MPRSCLNYIRRNAVYLSLIVGPGLVVYPIWYLSMERGNGFFVQYADNSIENEDWDTSELVSLSGQWKSPLASRQVLFCPGQEINLGMAESLNFGRTYCQSAIALPICKCEFGVGMQALSRRHDHDRSALGDQVHELYLIENCFCILRRIARWQVGFPLVISKGTYIELIRDEIRRASSPKARSR